MESLVLIIIPLFFWMRFVLLGVMRMRITCRRITLDLLCILAFLTRVVAWGPFSDGQYGGIGFLFSGWPAWDSEFWLTSK